MIDAKLKIKPAKRKDIYGSSRIGTIHASFDDLKKILGEPHDCTQESEWESDDHKVRVEWAFIIGNDKNLVFTVYDYKGRYPLDQIKQWSLGGKDPKVKDPLSSILTVE